MGVDKSVQNSLRWLLDGSGTGFDVAALLGEVAADEAPAGSKSVCPIW